MGNPKKRLMSLLNIDGVKIMLLKNLSNIFFVSTAIFLTFMMILGAVERYNQIDNWVLAIWIPSIGWCFGMLFLIFMKMTISLVTNKR